MIIINCWGFWSTKIKECVLWLLIDAWKYQVFLLEQNFSKQKILINNSSIFQRICWAKASNPSNPTWKGNQQNPRLYPVYTAILVSLYLHRPKTKPRLKFECRPPIGWGGAPVFLLVSGNIEGRSAFMQRPRNKLGMQMRWELSSVFDENGGMHAYSYLQSIVFKYYRINIHICKVLYRNIDKLIYMGRFKYMNMQF